MSDENQKINVRDWIILSTTMIGAVLTILALIWQARPTSGIVTVTFLLMLSFILFVNSVSANSRANYEANLGSSKERVQRFVSFAEYTFGLGFTFVIMGFSVLSYSYLMDFTNRSLLAFLLPVIFLVTTWIIILIYNIISYSGKTLKYLRNIKRNIWILIEIGCLFLIYLDFTGVILIP